ncbi:hypothetical protein C5746_32495 [Streptomyces atratus]|uniref:Uncharacterized protein n=1 Tax=Streptomyces atratus TaxID=1893 RepID=A0A2Z5JKF7_STRAR|nr:hypothetical protein C5746_32495 [Streptomyces atratus]
MAAGPAAYTDGPPPALLLRHSLLRGGRECSVQSLIQEDSSVSSEHVTEAETAETPEPKQPATVDG